MAWTRLGPEARIALLKAARLRTHAVAEEWVRLSARAKGLAAGSYLDGEEWISGPWAALYAINRYVRTLGRLARGSPPLPRGGASSVVRVFPHDLYDRILLSGVTADVWLRSSAPRFLERNHAGRVALVLGAGNISSIPALDVLYKLLAENAVCLLKLNPVNEYLRPILERALEPFVAGGFLRFASGGAAVGAQLCQHDAIDEIHVTGSFATYNAIKAAVGKRKHITGELGSVTPTIVVPGNWSVDELRFQAENIATQKAHNAGFNCIAAQVLVLPKEWNLKDRLLDEIAAIFRKLEKRPEYYPGAAQRRLKLAGDGAHPLTIVRLDPNEPSEAFLTEAFCGILFCVELPGDTELFLRNAVAFANDRLYGTLGVNLIAHPATEHAIPEAMARALADLHYGCIAVNAWAGIGYFITETPWGAYPDSEDAAGVVHNSYFLAQTQKSVVRAPFKPLIKPPWFVTNQKQARLGRLLCDFEAARTPLNAARVVMAAL